MNIVFEKATHSDLDRIIAMLIDDPLGAQRESSNVDSKSYQNAFRHIEKDPNNELIVARDTDSEKLSKSAVFDAIAVLQITYLPSLTYQGAWRAQIEGVRVHPDYRGHGLGQSLFEWSIARAQEKGCKIIQLTSDKQRPDAIRFYEKLGFNASHEGFKLHFD